MSQPNICMEGLAPRKSTQAWSFLGSPWNFFVHPQWPKIWKRIRTMIMAIMAMKCVMPLACVMIGGYSICSFRLLWCITAKVNPDSHGSIIQWNKIMAPNAMKTLQGWGVWFFWWSMALLGYWTSISCKLPGKDGYPWFYSPEPWVHLERSGYPTRPISPDGLCVAHVCCLQFSWLIHLSCPLLGFLSWDDASGIRVVHGLCPGACWYPSTCWKCHASWIQEPQSGRPGELCVETQLQQGAHVLVWTTAGACGMLQGCWQYQSHLGLPLANRDRMFLGCQALCLAYGCRRRTWEENVWRTSSRPTNPLCHLEPVCFSPWLDGFSLWWTNWCECSQRLLPFQKCGTRSMPSWTVWIKSLEMSMHLPQAEILSSSMMLTFCSVPTSGNTSPVIWFHSLREGLWIGPPCVGRQMDTLC